ncbi:hypothetical protein [Pseudobutyrivibrio sp. AR14]|uniref:hypothetical protein n=1 Tax=Pseudobutyrivibrio sp. AR14 TaxID=1520804 RepID=UPI002E8E53DB|nr:hypothetical protein [Pseudobutyrivibrio sp. AR14]
MADEIFDIVDENGQPTGERVTRSQAHADGVRHRTAHIWVLRENGDKTEVLLQKRALNKDSFLADMILHQRAISRRETSRWSRLSGSYRRSLVFR